MSLISRSGVGQFVPAFFTVPQNPVIMATGSGDGLGDFVRASFTVPQNPIWPGLAGLGCTSCGGSCKGMAGIGDDISAMFDGTAPTSTYLLYGGGALALVWLLFGRGGDYREASRRLRKKYRTRGSRAVSYARGS